MPSSNWLRRQLAPIAEIAIAIMSRSRKGLIALRSIASEATAFVNKKLVRFGGLPRRGKAETNELRSLYEALRSHWFSLTRRAHVIIAIVGSALAALVVAIFLLLEYPMPSPPVPGIPDDNAFSVMFRNRYVYLWSPQAADVSTKKDSQESNVLRFLLAHSETTQYKVLSGETVDGILRTRLFVFQSKFPHAYAIYLEAIHRYNSNLKDLCDVVAGDVLVLPDGPKFAALDHPEDSPETYEEEIEHTLAGGRHLADTEFRQLLWRNLRVFTRFKAHAVGSAKCGTEKSPNGNRTGPATSHSPSISLSLSRQETADSLPSKQYQQSRSPLFKAIVQEIKSRQIVPAVDPKDVRSPFFLNREPLPIYVGSTERMPISVAIKAYPAFVAASDIAAYTPPTERMSMAGVNFAFALPSDDTIADCKTCKKCRDFLGVSNTRSIGDVKVVVADTGITGLKALLFHPVPNVKYGDIAPNHHGTFVYSETVFSDSLTTEYGPLPSQSVYIAKVARPPTKNEDAPHGYMYDMQRVSKVMDAFSNDHSAALSAAANKNTFAPKPVPTWIANISASGSPQTATCCILTDPNDGILFVAAAGNDHQGDPIVMDRTLFVTDHRIDNDVFIVGALDSDGIKMAPYSNHHPDRVDLFAPGSCVCGLGVRSSHGTGQINGTSQATPIVTAAAAILASKHPKWRAPALKWRLISTSHLLDEFADLAVGGVLNLQEALREQFVVYIKGQDGPLYVDQIKLGAVADNWRKLLVPINTGNVSQNVLRLHQQSCGNGGSVCFMRYVMNRTPEKADKMPTIDGSSELTLEIAGHEKLVKALDVEDVILTIYQNFDGTILAPKPDSSP
jgi:subtilisin family serine protease